VDSAFFDNISVLFHPDRIRRRCYILTDKDVDFTSTKEHQRAEKLGLTRYNNLIVLKGKNSFIHPFFVYNTFEIQLPHHPLRILKEILKEKLIYDRDSKISEVSNSLDSTNAEDRYTAIMKCVNYVSKGWFAVLLVDFCDKNSRTLSYPYYIESAFKEMRAEK
jgi:putative ATP-dependent endonuclease of OLD family